MKSEIRNPKSEGEPKADSRAQNHVLSAKNFGHCNTETTENCLTLLKSLCSLRSLRLILLLLLMAGAAAFAQGSQEQLLATLASEAPLAEKWVAVRQLARIGTREAVPKLAALLPNEQLNYLARYALEAIPDPSVDEALREALGKLDGRPLAGVITSIGARRDALAVEALSKFLSRPDPALVSATVAALGNIGTMPAAKALEAALANAQPSIRAAICSSILQCADALRMHGYRVEAIEIYKWLRASKASPELDAAALHGLLLAGVDDALKVLAAELHAETTAILGPLLRDLPGLEVTEALAAEPAQASRATAGLAGPGAGHARRRCGRAGAGPSCPRRRKVRPARRHPRDGGQPRVRAGPHRVGSQC